MRVFAEFHRCGKVNHNTNATFIVLVPRKNETKNILDFKPISLIHVHMR